MNVVLMDTKHHKTVEMWPEPAGNTVKAPVDILRKNINFSIAVPTPFYAIAEFFFQGDFLRGDPIFMQVSGPEVAQSFWHP